MGRPAGPEYADNSNVTHAAQLQGSFLLIVGEPDHNVDPASTIQVVDALIKADKDFDLLVVSGGGDGAGGQPYGRRRTEDFSCSISSESNCGNEAAKHPARIRQPGTGKPDMSILKDSTP